MNLKLALMIEYFLLMTSKRCASPTLYQLSYKAKPGAGRGMMVFVFDISKLTGFLHISTDGLHLRPLFFRVYINDLPKCLSYSFTGMFADDTNLTINGSSVDEVENKLNIELEKVHQWLLANKLTLNKEKTEYMIICSRQRLEKVENDLEIKLLMYSRMVLMVVCWRYRMSTDANGCVSTLVIGDWMKWTYFCVNEFEVGVNDSIFSGNKEQKVQYTKSRGFESQPWSSRVFLYLPGMGSFHLE